MSEELDLRDLKMEDITLGGQPIVEPAAEPAAEPASEPAAEPANEPVIEPTNEPTNEQSNEPAKEPVSEPAKEPAKEPAREEFKWKDDFIKGVVEYYEKTGDITPYLQAKTVDFNQMADEEIMRRNLREQYPDVSEKAFERLYKQQVVDKFKLDADEWGEDDSELGKELLKSEASKIRQKYVEWQKNFTAPEPVKENSQVQDDSAAEALKAFEESVKQSELTKKLLEGKRLTIKDGDNEFAYEVPEAETLVDMTIDNNKFFAQFASTDGQVDLAKWYRTVAYSQNPEQFEKSLINYGKTLGRQEVTKEIKNPTIGKTPDVATEYEGDFKSGLLRAFAEKGVSK